jgi:bla regulator protein blaR1
MNDLFVIALNNLLVASVFALLAVLAGRWARRPALVHCLWLLFFLKLLTPPLFPIPVAWSSTEATLPKDQEIEKEVLLPVPEMAVAKVVEEPSPAPEMVEVLPLPKEGQEMGAIDLEPSLVLARTPNEEGDGFPWIAAAGVLWLAGSCCWFLLAGARLLRFRKQLRFAQAASDQIQLETRDLAGKLDVSCPDALVLPGKLSPMLWIFGRTPRLLLPGELLERLDQTQRQALLVHELAHWRRRDHWVRRLELVALGLYWWCPLVWWARRHLQEAEEECCDAWVLWLMPGAARGYALALVETLDFMAGVKSALPPAASGIGHVRLLQRRLTMIMRGKTPRTLTLGGGLAVLGLGTLLLPLIPSWAQSPNRPVPYNPEITDPSQQDLFQARRRELERAQQEIHAMQADLDRARQDLERRTKDMERRAKELHSMMDRLQKDMQDGPKKMEKKEIRIAVKDGDGWHTRVEQVPMGPDMDKRLREVERKLDMLIDMMTRKQPPGPPAVERKGAPGATAPGMRSGVPVVPPVPSGLPRTPPPAVEPPVPGQPPQPPAAPAATPGLQPAVR